MSDEPRWRNDDRRWEPDDSSWREDEPANAWQPQEPEWPRRDLQADDERDLWPAAPADAGFQPAQTDFPDYEAPRYEPPAPDFPPYEPPDYEAPRPEAPPSEPPRPEAPDYEAPRYEPPATDLPPYEPPRPEPPRPEAAEEAQPPQPPTAPLVEAGDSATAFNGTAWDPKLHGERRRPTTAEQAVPWLIGVILALAGIVIVLMALIFTTPDGLLAETDSPSPSADASQPAVLPSGAASGQAHASPTPEPTGSRRPDRSEEPTPEPAPEYGPLEMTYLGRQSAVAPVYLWRRDFSRPQDPNVMAQADTGINAYAWSPDGRIGAALIGERLVALQPGRAARPLADGINEVAFGLDSETLYAVRVRSSGANNVADVLEVGFRRGNERRLASVRYPRPAVVADPPLREAQFIDDGGQVRLYATADGNLALWILGAPSTYHVDSEDGTVTDARREPVLWSPNGMLRVDRREMPNGTTNLVLRDASGEPVAVTRAPGLVSHIRWVSSNNEIVFTLGTIAAGGGVRQDLYVWDLRDGRDPMPLTSNGVSFGAEWLGSYPHWIP